jgi:four helix bundle protein
MDYRDLIVYKKAFKLTMRIFEISKTFPLEEKFSLTDQIRRSSRSICTNIDEGYRKRRYPAHFVSKLSDSDMENTETQVWLNFSLACKYIDEATFNELDQDVVEIGRLLNYMMENPDKFGANKD